MVMKFGKLDAICIGELIRFKDNLLNKGKITKKEYDIITKYLSFIINEEEE